MDKEYEEEFIGRLRSRDPKAFRKLVERHKDRVYNTCLGFLHNRQDAEDMAQEVFIQVYEAIETFRGESSLATWIYRIAVTKSLELIRHRKRKKRRAFFESLKRGDDDPDEVSGEEFFVHPGIALEQKERAEILFREIGKLPENQKVAFTLHKVEGLAYKEIAEVMETSLAAVEALMHRAKKNLQKQLHEYYCDEL